MPGRKFPAFKKAFLKRKQPLMGVIVSDRVVAALSPLKCPDTDRRTQIIEACLALSGAWPPHCYVRLAVAVTVSLASKVSGRSAKGISNDLHAGDGAWVIIPIDLAARSSYYGDRKSVV